MLVFIVYHRSHFSLLVKYVDERRWEFYNSMDKDRRSMKHAEIFLSYSIVFVFLVDSLCFLKGSILLCRTMIGFSDVYFHEIMLIQSVH